MLRFRIELNETNSEMVFHMSQLLVYLSIFSPCQVKFKACSVILIFILTIKLDLLIHLLLSYY